MGTAKGNNMKLKLYKDKVISIMKDKDLVGVYINVKKGKYVCGVKLARQGEILLAEMSPEKADKIIKLWNSK